MKQYMGIKMISAEPMEKDGRAGYKVVYADGMKAGRRRMFSRRHIWRSLPNPHLKTDKPSISQQMVDDFIKETEVTTMGEKTTVVRAVLRNGFEIVESSACVSADNYDETLGAEICMKHIKDKVWMLLGFLLQTAVTGIK